MFRKYLFIFIVAAAMLFPGESNASPWRASDTKVEVRRDEYHGQHLYITFEEGPVKMMRASLPNEWKIAEARAIDEGIVPPTINYENPDPLCDLDYTPNKAVKRDINVGLSTSLGFGGHNAVLAFKKYTD